MSTPSKGYDSWTPKLTPYQQKLFGYTGSFKLLKYEPWFPEVADSNSLRCCFGIGAAPRCEKKGTYIPEIWDGTAYCREHIPVKKKGSWFMSLWCVRVER